MRTSRWIASLMLSSFLVVTAAPPGFTDDTSQAKDGGPGSTAAAAVADIFYVPGKAIVCGMSGVLYVATMILTFGALYQESTDFVKGGCGGRWVLTGEDIKPPAKSY